MKRRKPQPFTLQVSYTFTELAEMSGGSMDRWKVKRTLDSAGVKYTNSGRALTVTVAELEKKAPLLWESFQTLAQAQERAGRRRVS